MSDTSGPIILDFKSAQEGKTAGLQPLRTFTSYSFERNVLVPAAPFRFTAPGVDRALRQSIRSGDMVELFAVRADGTKAQVATGFVDETDTHVLPTAVEYVLSGRDTMGQLVDNAAVDAQNRVIQTTKLGLDAILQILIQNTRIPSSFKTQDIPNGGFLFQTRPGETKISALQRYLEFANCLIWSQPNGQLVLGKPDFTQDAAGKLVLHYTDPSKNNVLEGRVRRNVNTAIRQIVVQLQSLNQVDAGLYTKLNNDPAMLKVADQGVGRSVFDVFSYGEGEDSVNLVTQVGNQDGNPSNIGTAKALREIGRSNMQILDVELVVRGHLNSNGDVYDVDQVYNVHIPDDGVSEDLYVYSVTHDLTLDHGRTTRLRLCALGTIVAYAAIRRFTA